MITRTYSLEKFREINPKFCDQVDNMAASLLDKTGIPPSDCPDPECLQVYSKIEIEQTEINPIIEYLFGPKFETRIDLSVHCQGVRGENNHLVAQCYACPTKRLVE